jgi:DNA-binding transcriptional regulator GbsR (MarR family)
MTGRKRSRPYIVDDVRYVHQHYAEMTASEIADKLGISRFQVSKIVSELRKHIDLPKKTVRRPNPILKFLEEEGIKPKEVAKTKTTKEKSKKS